MLNHFVNKFFYLAKHLKIGGIMVNQSSLCNYGWLYVAMFIWTGILFCAEEKFIETQQSNVPSLSELAARCLAQSFYYCHSPFYK